jgi:hypothetical protein
LTIAVWTSSAPLTRIIENVGATIQWSSPPITRSIVTSASAPSRPPG